MEERKKNNKEKERKKRMIEGKKMENVRKLRKQKKNK